MRRPDGCPLSVVEPAPVAVRVGVDLGVTERPQEDLQPGAQARRGTWDSVELRVERMRQIEVEHPRSAFLYTPVERRTRHVFGRDAVGHALAFGHQLALDGLRLQPRLAGPLLSLLVEILLGLLLPLRCVLRLL